MHRLLKIKCRFLSSTISNKFLNMLENKNFRRVNRDSNISDAYTSNSSSVGTSTQIMHESWECAFLLRGKAVAGVNDYLPQPRYVEGEHMAFRGCEMWSASADGTS